MARPTKKGMPASAVFVYDDTTDKYIAWDGNIDLASGDIASEATQLAVAGLVIGAYNYLELSYVASGFGVGEIQTVIYKSGGSGGMTVATLTLTYDSSNRLSTITRT